MQHSLISQQNIKVKDNNIGATQFNFTTKHQCQRKQHQCNTIYFRNKTSRSKIATSMKRNLISQQNIKVKDSNINETQFNFTTKHQGQR